MNWNSGYKIFLAVIALAITAYYFYYPSLDFLPNMQCLFNRTTGLYCLGCGGQRAFHTLLHGHIAAAAQNNILVFLVIPLLGVKLFEEFSDKKIFPPEFYSIKIVLSVFLFVILFTILRNIPSVPFIYLVPTQL